MGGSSLEGFTPLEDTVSSLEGFTPLEEAPLPADEGITENDLPGAVPPPYLKREPLSQALTGRTGESWGKAGTKLAKGMAEDLAIGAIPMAVGGAVRKALLPVAEEVGTKTIAGKILGKSIPLFAGAADFVSRSIENELIRSLGFKGESSGERALASALDTLFFPGARNFAKSPASRAAAFTEKQSVGGLLQLKEGVAKGVDRAVTALQESFSRKATMPQKLVSDLTKGDAYEVAKRGGTLLVTRRGKPKTLSELYTLLQENIKALDKFKEGLAKDLDDVAAKVLPAKKTSLLGAPLGTKSTEVKTFTAEETTQLKELIRDIGETENPIFKALEGRLDSFTASMGSSDLSFSKALKEIKALNSNLEMAFKSTSGEAKPGTAAARELLLGLKEKVYEELDQRILALTAKAKQAKIPLPKQIEGWSTVMKDLNMRESVEIGLKEGIDDFLYSSRKAIGGLEAKANIQRTLAQEAPRSTIIKRSPRQEAAAQAALDEQTLSATISDRDRILERMLEALKPGSSGIGLESLRPNPIRSNVSAIAAAIPNAIPAQLPARGIELLGKSVLAPSEARAEEMTPGAAPQDSVGLPAELLAETERRSQELGLDLPATPTPFQSAGLPPEMVNPVPAPAPMPIPQEEAIPSPLDSAGEALPQGEGEPPRKPLPRTTNEFFNAATEDIPSEILLDEEARTAFIQAQNGTPEDRRQALYTLTQKFPQLFVEPPNGPLRNYKSLIDDKLMDETERTKYRTDLLEATQKLPDQNERILARAEYLDALNQDGTILEVTKPLPRKGADVSSAYSELNAPPEKGKKPKETSFVSKVGKNAKAEKHVAYSF